MKIFWLKQSLKDIPSSLGWLHASELNVYSGFKFPKKRKDWLLGRWTAKNLVRFYVQSKAPDLKFNELEIISAPDGAPEVFHKGSRMPLLISLSHSHSVCFCVVSDPELKMGCDLEKIEERSDLFIKDYFTEKECSQISNMEPLNRALFSNLVWSAKESALKALRSGLRLDTRKVEVEFSQDNENAPWGSLNVTEHMHGSVFHGFWKSD